MHLHLLRAYPPGTDLDAGLNGLDALKPLRYGVWPFYILNNSNPDPLFVYLQSLSTALFGARIIALRLPSIFSGWLGFAALYATLLELGRGSFDRTMRHRLALLALAALATSQVLALLHRMGLRFSTAALFELAAVWALARAVRANRRLNWIAAAVLAAVTQYTYPTARLVPLLLLLVLLIMAWRKPRCLRALLPGLLIYAFTAVVVMLPQIVWYSVNPETLLARASQTSLNQHPLYATAGAVAAIWSKLQLYWQALGSYWLGQYNHIKEPLLSRLFYGGFILAVPVGLFYIRRRFVHVILAGMVVMVLPEMIAGASDWPHELRLIGVYPFVAALAGLGLGGAWSFLRRWPWLDTIVGVALAGAVAVSMYAEAAEFFSLDRNYGKLYWNQNWWLGRIEAGVGTLIANSDETYLLPLEDYSRNVVKYLVANRARIIRSAVQPDGTLSPALHADRTISVLLPNQTQSEAWNGDPTQWVLVDANTVYVLPPLDGLAPALPRRDEATLVFGSGVEEIVALGHMDRIQLSALNLPNEYPLQYDVNTCFVSGLCLRGVSYGGTQLTDGKLRLHLYWTSSGRVKEDFTFFVHLLDLTGAAIAGEDDFPLEHGYRTYEWRADEMIITTHEFPIPSGLAPGRYALEIGMYALPSIERAPTIDDDGQRGDNRVVLSHLKVARPPVALPEEYSQAEVAFASGIELIGYRVEAAPIKASELNITLWWRALQPDQLDWTAFFHVTPATDNTALAGQLDRTITAGAYPPSVWDVGEIVEEQIALDTSALTPGEYEIWMGLYSPLSLERDGIAASAAPVADNRTRLLQFTLGEGP
ncbi:MAG: ArnT family glycosyltransferase [Anaerolineales bacterium]